MDSSEKSFLQYYLQELAMLEDDGAEFAQSYPQLAANLGLGSEGSSDPHVRQLIESVAFIAARLKRQIDIIPGVLAYDLLQAAAPHLTAPVPAMSVAKFAPLSPQLEPIGIPLPANLRLQATANESVCSFSACSNEIRLWPLQLSSGWAGSEHHVPGIADSNTFVLRIEHASKPLAHNAPENLTLFISGALNRALAAVEAFMVGVREVRMVALDGAWSLPLARGDMNVLGFEPEHRLMPAPHSTPHAGRLTLEFLNFPRRFCFLQVRGLRCPVPARGFFLVFAVQPAYRAALEAVRQNIHLNCVPIINVFARPPVALRLQGVHSEYLIARPEAGRGKWDVFGVHQVRLAGPGHERVIPAFHSGAGTTPGAMFWQGRRRERIGNSLGHASLTLRFGGLDAQSAEGIALLDLSCTNCEAAENLFAGQVLTLQNWASGYAATLEFTPTAYVPPLLATSRSINDILKILQWRTAGADGIGSHVRQYLAVHSGARSAYAVSLSATLINVQRQMVAMPWPGMPPGSALGMGCRYRFDLKSGKELFGSQYLFSRLLRHIVTPMHDLSCPLEVLSTNAQGEVRYVD